MSPMTFSIPSRCPVVRSVTGLAMGKSDASGSKGRMLRTAALTSLKSSKKKPKDGGSSLSQSVHAKHVISSNRPTITLKQNAAKDAIQSEDPQSREMKIKVTSVYVSSFRSMVVSSCSCQRLSVTTLTRSPSFRRPKLCTEDSSKRTAILTMAATHAMYKPHAVHGNRVSHLWWSRNSAGSKTIAACQPKYWYSIRLKNLL
mmetsp:Transcript_25846/g.47260  ORF Transcript_25846/g.47260 Transcript_25846/m.47260 type:complete len:201 (-) Transcript_25846:79-681(-)